MDQILIAISLYCSLEYGNKDKMNCRAELFKCYDQATDQLIIPDNRNLYTCVKAHQDKEKR